MSTEIKRLPADWSKDLGIDVLDPDGWRCDSTPWGLAITEPDFRRRAAMSTMREVATPAPSLLDQHGDDDGREAAPLDPKSVHVGDTVTVRFKETGDVVTTKAYQPDDITAPGEYVYLLGWPLHRANGTFGLAFSHFEILAIEPAPEPEPEPRERVVDILIDYSNNRADDYDTADRIMAALAPNEPRPLPTRDDLARIMHDDYLPNGMPRLGRTAREELAAAVLRFLRGEVR